MKLQIKWPLFFITFFLLVQSSHKTLNKDIKRLPSSITKIEIDRNERYQFIEGWGTSLAWWANAVGTWNEKNLNTLVESIFGKSGLEMNIVRYNIGGGENPSHHHMRDKADIEGFKSSQNSPYNWKADQTQIKVLLLSKTYGANLFEAFSNSPPYWMTYDFCAAGAKNGQNNLRDDMYDDFAEYLVEVVHHFKTSHKLEFHSLSPMNEPISTWWKSSNNQEGCHFDRDKQVKLIEEVSHSLKRKNLSTYIAAPEENSINDTVWSMRSYPNSIQHSIKRINTHSYNGYARHELRDLAWNKGQAPKTIWNSEVGIGGLAGHDHHNMASALALAKKIREDVQEMGTSGWVYWQAVEDEALQHDWGLLHANFNGPQEFWTTKQYWAFAQFSKFVKPWSQSIGYYGPKDENGITGTAFLNPQKKLVLILVNSSDRSQQVSVEEKNENKNLYFESYLTSNRTNLQKQKMVGNLITLPPFSIMTLVEN